MNGFISRKALRFTLVTSACLLSGFVSGTQFHGLNLDALFPRQEVNYSKISWISKSLSSETLTLATVDYPVSDLQNREIKLADFHLPNRRIFAKKQTPTHPQSLDRLEAAVALLKTRIEERIPSETVFKDYRKANQQMHQRVLLSVNTPAPKAEQIVIASSSAETSVKPEEKMVEPIVETIVLPKKESDPLIAAVAVSAVMNEKIESTQPKPLKTRPEEKKVRLTTQKVNTQMDVEAATQPITKIEEQSFAQGRLGIPLPVEKKPVVLMTTPPVVEKKKSEEMVASKKSLNPLETKLRDDLLAQQIQNYQGSKKRETPPSSLATAPAQEVDEEEETSEMPSLAAAVSKDSVNQCSILPQLRLVRPFQGSATEDTQICATQNDWISKSWNQEGWVKAKTESFLPFLAFYPQVNSNKVLLLDQNAIALLAIRSGVQVEQGSGMILGTLPKGYQINFSGRSEEVQYFDVNDQKYFMILNAETGAGVTELVSQKDVRENATVFTPVLADTVTYLDLATPIQMNIAVKIIKGKKGNAETAGLSVNLSTQTQVQASTNNAGAALLKGVRVVPGYPVFVDTSSRFGEERSYQYRYQLNRRTRNGVFVLKQYPEKTIHQWFKQIKANVSDQSGYVFGEFNRKRLNGFKSHYSAKAETLTEKLGLNAKTYSVLWNDQISEQEPLEGDTPRYLTVQIPEGLAQAHLLNERNQIVQTSLIPVSPRVINVVSE